MLIVATSRRRLGQRKWALFTMRRSLTKLAASLLRARGSGNPDLFYAECPLRLSPLGSRREGATTRQTVSRRSDGTVTCRPLSTIGAPVEHSTSRVEQVSQAVLRCDLLENLIDTLMRTAMEQAGAERARWFSVPGKILELMGSTTSGDRWTVLWSTSRDEARASRVGLHYFMRTRETVSLDDAAPRSPFGVEFLYPSAPGPFHSLASACSIGPTHRRAHPKTTYAPRAFSRPPGSRSKMCSPRGRIALENALCIATSGSAKIDPAPGSMPNIIVIVFPRLGWEVRLPRSQ